MIQTSSYYGVHTSNEAHAVADALISDGSVVVSDEGVRRDLSLRDFPRCPPTRVTF